jgi:hypothetical protein
MVERSESEKCPTCGTTRITFDPPLYFEFSEACGEPAFIEVSVNGAKSMSTPVTCLNFKGHEKSEKISERGHYYLLEEMVTWLSMKS